MKNALSIIALTASTILFIAGPSVAADNPCADATTMQAVASCRELRFEKAEASLSTAIKTLTEVIHILPPDAAYLEKELAAAVKAWRDSRDKTCGLAGDVYYPEFDEGSGRRANDLEKAATLAECCASATREYTSLIEDWTKRLRIYTE